MGGRSHQRLSGAAAGLPGRPKRPRDGPAPPCRRGSRPPPPDAGTSFPTCSIQPSIQRWRPLPGQISCSNGTGWLPGMSVAAESIPGGFSGLYPVLARMEETGRVRRGYFVEGLGGAQFALPGAVDRLRQLEASQDGAVLAATDPANPYGSALPWPQPAAGRAGRSAGAYVVMESGDPGRLSSSAAASGCSPSGRTPIGLRELGARARGDWPTPETDDHRDHRRHLQPARHRSARLLEQSGFTDSYKGLAYHRRQIGHQCPRRSPST